MRRIALLLIVLQFSSGLHSQRGNHWQFGQFAALDFTTGIPLATNNSAMHQLEGSSSISDLNGNLLFYSDGTKIWNAQHILMPNGSGLLGHFSSTQSSMIIPFPADPKRYYVFTVDYIFGTNGLCYSIVNMDLDGGLGDVEQKNVQLVTNTSEKIAAVNHCNGVDVWVITNRKDSDEFYAYLVTAGGVNSPIISHSGRTGPSFSSLGYLKLSPDGSRMAVAHYELGLDLFDFNAITGAITNRKEIISKTENMHSYGVEFSPNSKLLYVSGSKKNLVTGLYRYHVNQYNHLDSSLSKITGSKTELDADSAAYPLDLYAALQLGPDNRMYVTSFSRSILPIIQNPDLPGPGCNYVRNGIPLHTGTGCTYGFPDFNQSYFKRSFSFDISCTTNQASFYFSRSKEILNVKWDFDDPASGVNNTAVVDSPTHIFSAPGLYTVKMIAYKPCLNDTFTKTLRIDPIMVNLGADREICTGTPEILNPVTQGSISYLWQDNSTDSILEAHGSGLYWVEIKNSFNGCTLRDSILITLKPALLVDLGKDTAICESTGLLLDAGHPGSTYTWQDNSQNQTYQVTSAGQYFVKVVNDGCISSDTIVIGSKYYPEIIFVKDTAICPGMSIHLNPLVTNATNVTYLWSTGETVSSIVVTQPGSYSLTATNSCGSGIVDINVKNGVCKLYVPSGFTPNSDGRNDTFKPGFGENVISYSMAVYNRWGEQIFTSRQISNGWDGRVRGTLQPPGIFAWIIRYKIFNDPQQYTLKGTVALIY